MFTTQENLHMSTRTQNLHMPTRKQNLYMSTTEQNLRMSTRPQNLHMFTKTQNLYMPTRTKNKHHFKRRPPFGSIRLKRLIKKYINITFKGNNQRNTNPNVFVYLLIYLRHLIDIQVTKHIKKKLKQI